MAIHAFIFLYLTIQITLSDVLVYDNSSNKTYETFPDEESNFNPSIPSEGITGYITTVNPPGGCSRIDRPPNIPTFGYKWIALIPRVTSGEGSCEFVTKIKNAYEANYSAAIIYNYDEQLITMAPYGKDVGIPSTLIAHSSGLSLIKNYLYNITSINSTSIYHVKIIMNPAFKYGNYLIPFASVIGISFFGLLGFMLVKCHLERRRARRHRLPRSALKKLKIKKFVKSDPYEVCAICLDDYEEGAKLRILPCDHAYHVKCIDPWLLNNRSQCPVCKRYVFPNQNNSDEEENNNRPQVRSPTEQTPLVNPNNDNSNADISRNQQSPERQLLNPSDNGVSNVSFASGELSDDEKDLSLSSGPATTAELVFERSSWNPRRYGSMNNSSITSRNANYLVGSIGGTTDNTNTSRRSMADDISDFETTDEPMHSIRDVPEENPAYVDDEQSSDTNQTRL